MAWIESHQDLLDHPKILRLSRTLGISQNEAIGVVHRFWWWALKYAEDGDLRRFNDDDLAHAVGLNGRGKDFVEAMVTCGGDAASGFIDREPYFRIHDWWDYAGKFLQSKYKHNPVKYKRISKLYKNRSRVVHRTVKEHDTLPNLTLHNQPNKTEPEKKVYGEFSRVLLSDEELQKLQDKFGPEGTTERITNLDLALENQKEYRKKYSSHYATILSWDRRDSKGQKIGKSQKTFKEIMAERGQA